MANFIGLVYATLKNEGIDTKGMSTEEAVDKYNELKGKGEGTPAEQRKMAEKAGKDGFDKLSAKYDIVDRNNIDGFIKDYNKEFGTELSVDGNDILNENYEDVYNLGKGAQVEFLINELSKVDAVGKPEKQQGKYTGDEARFNKMYDLLSQGAGQKALHEEMNNLGINKWGIKTFDIISLTENKPERKIAQLQKIFNDADFRK